MIWLHGNDKQVQQLIINSITVLHHSRTYHNENIFMLVIKNIVNGQADEIKCHYSLISQVFLSMTKICYTLYKKGGQVWK